MSRDDTGIVKAGMAIVISSGCYSDYSFGQVYIALKDFNYMDEAKKFIFEQYDESYNKESESELYEEFGYPYIDFYELDSKFEAYLIKNGFLGLCDYRNIHIGDNKFFDDLYQEWLEEWEKERGLEDEDD